MKIIYILAGILVVCLAYTLLSPRIFKEKSSSAQDAPISLASGSGSGASASEGSGSAEFASNNPVAGFMSGGAQFIPTPKRGGSGEGRPVYTDTEIREFNHAMHRVQGEVMRELAIQKYDVDGDGKLSGDERRAMRENGRKVGDRVQAAFKEVYKHDDNGKMLPAEEQQMREDMRALFTGLNQENLARYDKNHDNVISGDELDNMRAGMLEDLSGKDMVDELIVRFRQQVQKRKQAELAL